MQSHGMEKGTIIADPLFTDAANFDFTLKCDSPALKSGFKPIDMTDVGPQNNKNK
jgi:hypothetical protein